MESIKDHVGKKVRYLQKCLWAEISIPKGIDLSINVQSIVNRTLYTNVVRVIIISIRANKLHKQ